MFWLWGSGDSHREKEEPNDGFRVGTWKAQSYARQTLAISGLFYLLNEVAKIHPDKSYDDLFDGMLQRISNRYHDMEHHGIKNALGSEITHIYGEGPKAYKKPKPKPPEEKK